MIITNSPFGEEMNLNINTLRNIPRLEMDEMSEPVLHKDAYIMLSDERLHLDNDRVSLLKSAKDALDAYGLTEAIQILLPELQVCETTEEAVEAMSMLSDKALSSLNERISTSFENLGRMLRNAISLQVDMKDELTTELDKLSKIYSPVWKNEDREFGIPEMSVTKFFSSADKHLDVLDSAYSAIIEGSFKTSADYVKVILDDKSASKWLREIDISIDTSAKHISSDTASKDAKAISKKIEPITIANKRVGRTISKYDGVKNMSDDTRDVLVKTITNAHTQINSINRVTIRYAGVYISLLKNMGLQKNQD